MKTWRMIIRALLIPLMALIFLGSGFQIAMADEITVSNGVEAQLTNWIREISVSKFHPDNGKLVEVRTTVNSGLLGDVQYESLELNPAVLQIGMEADILLYGTDGELLAATHPTTVVTRAVTTFDDFWDYDGTSGGHITDLIAVDIVEAETITDPVKLQSYIGTDELFLGISGSGRSYIDGTGNLASLFSLLAYADIFITYVYEPPSIDIEKFTNGEDADAVPGPTLEFGADVSWEYVVENTGLNPLIDVIVTDDQGVVVDCPKSTLAPGEQMTCTGSGTAIPGQYTNEGAVSGQPTDDDGTPTGERVSDRDLSHYIGFLPPGAIGDNVWLDINQDGVQNDDEQTIEGVTVRLLNEARDVLETSTTTAQGYLFENLAPDIYIIEVDPTTLPENVVPTVDADGIDTPHESTIELPPSEANLLQDFGYTIATIDIEKSTNGEDADTPTGPTVAVGNPIVWEYIVTNNNAIPLFDIAVTDNQGVVVTCPATELAAGESMICTAEGIAQPDQYMNIGTVTALTGSPTGISVSDSDTSHYFGSVPVIDIETHTNGEDADTPTGPEVPVGTPIEWEYIVTNESTIPLVDVEVTDNQSVSITCPQRELAPGETMICTAEGIAQPEQYMNVGSVTGHAESSTGVEVSDTDPSHYFGVSPLIDIETHTNGEDADSPTGPEIQVGDPVFWEYIVTNTSTIDLVDIEVTDNQGVVVTCPASELAAGASMTCTAQGTALPDQYGNVGSVIGRAGSAPGIEVTDTDPSHYLGISSPACPTELLPQVEYLGGTETRADRQKHFTLPDGFDLFLVKRTHAGPFRFDIESGATTEDGERVYTTTWGKIERVWACAGNCTFTQALEGSVEIGQAAQGATIHAVIIDNDVDDRHMWWSANEPQERSSEAQEEGMTVYVDYEVPFDANWHIYSEDSIGVVTTCIEEPPAGGGDVNTDKPDTELVTELDTDLDNGLNIETALPFIVFPVGN